MGLQRRTAIAALAIQRRQAEALSEQPSQNNCLPGIQRRGQKKLLGYQARKSPENAAQDRQLVRIFQQSLGLLPRPEEPSVAVQTEAFAPLLTRLKVRALQQLSKDNEANGVQSHILGEYESLTNELIRVSDYLGLRQQHLESSESDDDNEIPQRLFPHQLHSTWQTDDDKLMPTINSFRIHVKPLPLAGETQTLPSLSQKRLSQPPRSLDEYRLRIKGAIEEYEITPSQEVKQIASTPSSPVASLKRLIWQSRQVPAIPADQAATNEMTDNDQQRFYLSLLNS